MPELDTILQTAERILNPDPDPVVCLRLLRDRSEKNGRWPTGWRLSAASTPAQIQPHHPALDSIWELWIPVARRIFASGTYNRQAEISSHRESTGASVADSYLVVHNKYTHLAQLAC
jgi:hypothetical protein